MQFNESVYELPPGYFRKHDEYVCRCPFCGRDEHFEWNVEQEKGHCWSGACKRALHNRIEFTRAFRDNILPVRVTPKHKDYKYVDQNEQIPAWDHPKSQLWLLSKNIHELAARELDIRYNPVLDRLYVDIEPLSKDLPRSFLERPLTGNKKKLKWLHQPGTKATYYGWGLSKALEHKDKPLLVVEGLSDLLATKLWDRGIAALGSDLNPIWFFWFSRHFKKLIFWFDADDAGEKAYTRCSKLASDYKIEHECFRTKYHPKCYAPQLPSSRPVLELIRRKLEYENPNDF